MYDAPKLNTEAEENSYLSKRVKSNIIYLQCIHYEANKLIAYQTKPDAPFYLKSIREVAAVSDQSTTFYYTIHFDSAIVKHALGFALPAFLIKMAAKKDLSK